MEDIVIHRHGSIPVLDINRDPVRNALNAAACVAIDD